MKCPHCSETISLFSRAINRVGRAKSCHHFQKSVRIVFSWSVMAICFAPVVLLTLALRPWLNSFASLPGLMLMFLLAMRLKPVEQHAP